ncbi:HK97 family phage prohead protease [Paraburkholderia ribeironis]|uniref:HK97 family phage prohead protease n=1 Tax=Paraburkholderia ribeironis TaxID=1247936 RepID=UPI001C3FA56C|nr:HK97 family phage prohead protease [Paraburkholderia ribeironis]
MNVNEDERTIEGIATSGNVDAYSDIVVPSGAEYSLPVPLLWQHQHDKPIGAVISAQRDETCLRFRAQIAHIQAPGLLADRVNEAWESVKAQLVRAVSIGFISLQSQPITGGGRRHVKWRWCELSLVTIGANSDARIEHARHLTEVELMVERALAEDRARRPRLDYSGTHVVRLADPLPGTKR